MDWVPIVLLAFKVVVLGVCMFFSIKWHYDQGKKKNSAAGGGSRPVVPPTDTPSA
jgi:hypothetical protein